MLRALLGALMWPRQRHLAVATAYTFTIYTVGQKRGAPRSCP